MPQENMDTTKHIQLFAKLYLAATILYLVASFMLESRLPSGLQEYLNSEFERESTPIEDFIFLLLLPILVAHITAIFGLIKIKRWAKKLFFYSTSAAFVAGLFIGPYLAHSVSAILDSIALILLGIIIALLIFTQSAFNKALKAQPSAAGDAASGAP